MLLASETYEQLLREARPQRIADGDDERYDRTGAQISALIRKGRNRTEDESKLMDLLVVLMQDYDRRHPFSTQEIPPHEMLRFIMEESGRPNSDLLPVFGTRSHVSEAVNGKRPISADQARKLGALFHVKPGLFI
jgi:HTH-type transcriptional regulator / antitoxin HigA